MQNNDNQKTYFNYVRSTGEKVPVTNVQHDSFYKEADRIRHEVAVTKTKYYSTHVVPPLFGLH